MNRIRLLPKEVSELIAAGEVVERPASAVKELMENAVDAGASALTVEIKNGGVSLIRVTDNGCGIPSPEVPTAFLRHATSKVREAGDLEGIATLGFRGEALASIAAVSRLEMTTRTAEELAGAFIRLEGGEIAEQSEAGCPQGTTILVRDLFFNTPARMKFLKKDVSEGNAVASVVQRIALSHPEISVRFLREGREELNTPGDNRLLSAVHAVLGKAFAEGLIPLKYDLSGIAVTGYMSRPTAARANRGMQFFFLNGRLVKSRTMMAALEEACKGSVMAGRFPGCVMQVKMPFSEVDVNVHPAKIEVRFANEHAVFEAVYYTVKSCLVQHDTRPAFDLAAAQKLPAGSEGSGILHEAPDSHVAAEGTEKNHPDAGGMHPDAGGMHPDGKMHPGAPDTILLPQSAEPADQLRMERFPPADNRFTDAATAAEPSAANAPAGGELRGDLLGSGTRLYYDAVQNERHKNGFEFSSEPIPSGGLGGGAGVPEKAGAAADSHKQPVRVLGECFDTYIVAEQGDTLWLIDKHAAHERLLYEELKKNGRASAQMLMTPEAVALSPEEYGALFENRAELAEAGFEIEEFGGATVLVRAAPMALRAGDMPAALEEIAAGLAAGKKDPAPERLEWLYHNVACRAAVKGGDKSARMEIEKLAARILEFDDVRYCPHGRPVAFALPQREIEKQFGRLG